MSTSKEEDKDSKTQKQFNSYSNSNNKNSVNRNESLFTIKPTYSLGTRLCVCMFFFLRCDTIKSWKIFKLSWGLVF